MTDEEKKAIENIKEDIKYADLRDLVDDDCTVCFVEDLETILNLLEKQDNRIKELESDKEIKNKIIDRMAEYINKLDIVEDICAKNIINPELCNEQYYNCKECIKQHFENLAKESGEIDDKRI